jgi:hypothetical protein
MNRPSMFIVMMKAKRVKMKGKNMTLSSPIIEAARSSIRPNRPSPTT